MRCMGIICSAVWTGRQAVAPAPRRWARSPAARASLFWSVKGLSGVSIQLRSLFGKAFRQDAMSAIMWRTRQQNGMRLHAEGGGIRIHFQSGCRVVSRCAKSVGSRRQRCPCPSVVQTWTAIRFITLCSPFIGVGRRGGGRRTNEGTWTGVTRCKM